MSKLIVHAFVFVKDLFKKNKSRPLSQGKTKQFSTRRGGWLPIEWLDENTSGIIKKLEPERTAVSYGPRINGSQLIEQITLPAVNLYYFENARVCPKSSSILMKDRIIIERAKGVDVQVCDFSSGYIYKHDSNEAFITTSSQSHHLDKGIFLGGNGSSNYYHWIIEILPKLMYLKDLNHGHLKNFPFLVSEEIINTKTFRDALYQLDNDRPIMVLDKNKTYSTNKLLYINSINVLPYNLVDGAKFKVAYSLVRKSSIEFLREKLVINPKDKKQTQAKRIFFARRGIRRKYNQHQVFDILKKHDFTQVYMEDLSLKDQISLMSNAENIIGPTGASWTNIIFCHTGVKCLLWMPDMASEFSAFSNLAELVGARLNCITYKVQADSLRSLYFMDYSVNLKEIHKELLTLLDS